MNSRNDSTARLKSKLLALSLSAALAQWGVALSAVPPRTPQTWTVLNCSDDDTDSLRFFVEENPNTVSGDTIDLSHLPISCGAADSTIMLSSEITIAQDALTLKGPAPGSGTVTISGGGAHQVFHHTGYGWLSITNLVIADGDNEAITSVFGGCIFSNGSVNLDTASVTGCTASSALGYALGGGIAAGYDVQLVNATISGNLATAPSAQGRGGGIYARGALLSKYSSVRDNEASSSYTFSQGGGAIVFGGAGVYHSSITSKQAGVGGGLAAIGVTHVANSTISGNRSAICSGLVVSSGSSTSLEISNSTIAANYS